MNSKEGIAKMWWGHVSVRVTPRRGEGGWRENTSPCFIGWSSCSLLCNSKSTYAEILKEYSQLRAKKHISLAHGRQGKRFNSL